MVSIYTVIFFSLIGGIFSLIGGFILIRNKSSAKKLVDFATPFAAGALLAAAFFDLLPDAIEQASADAVLSSTLAGILLFFLLEKFLHWFHHHHEHEDTKKDPVVPLIIIGDTMHNFIDGIAIALGFLVDAPTGIIVTIAVAAHEIPQEIGDFGLLLSKGMSKANVIKVNILSALATTLAAVLFFALGEQFTLPLHIVIGLIAGFFIYIAASDIIPSIHHHEEKRLAGPQTALLLLGVIVVYLVTANLHHIIDAGHIDDNSTETQSQELHLDEDEDH